MEFDFDGKKILSENGKVKQYTLSTKYGSFKCDCDCNVFTKFVELYGGEELYECNVCHKYWGGIKTATFDLVEQGDLVCGVDEHSADIRVVEGIVKNEGENNNVLLVNSRKDLFYEGTEEIGLFNREWRLLCKRESLVK